MAAEMRRHARSRLHLVRVFVQAPAGSTPPATAAGAIARRRRDTRSGGERARPREHRKATPTTADVGRRASIFPLQFA